MATITSLFGMRHLRSETSAHVLRFRRGERVSSGRGPSFWFLPMSTTVAEVPCDDREEMFLFHARSADFQDVTAQGVITYRVREPEVLAHRVDFSIDTRTGAYRKNPLEQVSQLLVGTAQQHAWSYLAASPVRRLLQDGVDEVRARISRGLVEDEELRGMGIEIVSVRVSGVAPTAELEKALQAPTHEAIQEEADEAMFQRRALAVEKERAIQENELQNRIELAGREEELISREDANERKRAAGRAEARRITAVAQAERRRTLAAARADAIASVSRVRVDVERERMEVYRGMPVDVLMGLAARELAGKLESIEHLSITPETIGPVLERLARAGTRRLEEAGAAPPMEEPEG